MYMPSLSDIFFHRDYDGIVSAAILLSVTGREPALHPVDYHLGVDWRERRLPGKSAVVDFLYHPDAVLWFDHHGTPFVCPEWEKSFKPDKLHQWQPSAPACPALMLATLETSAFVREHFLPFSEWASIIDSAQYADVHQATDLSNPYLKLARALAYTKSDEIVCQAVVSIVDLDIQEILAQSEINALVRDVEEMEAEARLALEKIVQNRGSIAIIDQVGYRWPFLRYHPYLLYPDAKFVIGIYKGTKSYTVSVGANPWRSAPAIDIGRLCSRWGGGGHAMVGGIVKKDYPTALATASAVEAVLRNE